MPLAGSYLDRDEFKARAIVPAMLVDGSFLPVAQQAAWQAFVDSRLKIATSRINGRLAKRYAVPFVSPVPEIVLDWLIAIVVPKLYERRGWDPADEQAQAILKAAETAEAEMKEASDGEVGLYDLPTIEGSSETGVTKGGPYASSDASPYAWIKEQRDRGREDDRR